MALVHLSFDWKTVQRGALSRLHNFRLIVSLGLRGPVAASVMQRGLTQQRSSPDDLAETQKKIEAAGGTFLFDLGDERRGNLERKFKDPEGVVFDISKNGWIGTDRRFDSQKR